ncbi:hypothetical protein B0T24DRAFT_685854 [Lasiosphaeria ovina]|uniref:Tc toxin complex TcA C-terminal TcB-binding domain-containing protein n=1 Tax=Lasiosphaeria ovina TaxID=92902 RepID=A0AAE0NIE1_9PEZI|nr:hypothetical protein B0T24DRAFT_685854 [Lasiosphaeria ovina]
MRIRSLSVSIPCATGPYTALAATLSPTEHRYRPFKGAGAVSSWKLALPRLVARQFDYASVSDVVLHLRYTDVDGGPMLRSAVTEALSLVSTQIAHVGARDGLRRRSQWSFQKWLSFRAVLRDSADDRVASMDLREVKAARLPFWGRSMPVNLESLTVVVGGGSKDKAFGVNFLIPALGEKTLDKTTLGDFKIAPSDPIRLCASHS